MLNVQLTLGHSKNCTYCILYTVRGKQYDLPNGAVPRQFVHTLSDEVDALAKGEHPSERVLIFISVMLQRDKMVKQAKDIRHLLNRRMDMWGAQEFDALINEALHADKQLMNHSYMSIDDAQIIKVFSRLMMKGKVRDAMNWIVENGRCSVLNPCAVNNENGKTVFDILKEKHPEPVQPDESLFVLPEDMTELPYLQQITITNEIVEKVSRKLHGGGGPGGSNSEQWHDFLLRYGRASHRLRDSVAFLTNEMCNHTVEWKQIHALMSCRLIALDKCPGVRPIGIGECLRRILSKCVIEVTKSDVTGACQVNQLCSGLGGGIEGAVHAMQDLFERNCVPGSKWGLLIVDAKNAFNVANRQSALWQARCYWPRAARFLYNTYRGHPELVIRDADSHLYSKEGVIQGDPCSMPLYALATLPLVKSLQHPDITQCWYADDSSAQGSFESLLEWWKSLTDHGPAYGYHPEGTKSCLIVSEEDKDSAEQVFNGSGINVVTGKRFLGGFIGADTDRKSFMNNKIDEWISTVEKLAMVAKQEPQAAYSAFVKSMQFKWTYFQRVLNDGENDFQSLKDVIRSRFLPALFDGHVSDDEADLFSLPVKKGGLGIIDPYDAGKLNYDTSKEYCSTIVSAILNKEPLNLSEHINTMNNVKKKAKEKRKTDEDTKLETVLNKFDPEKKRAIERSVTSIMKAGASGNSVWLSVLPIKRDHYDLSPHEFRDALAVRYRRQPVDMPQSCDGCGRRGFDLDHALCCKTGGLITRRHNEVRDLLGELCEKAWGNVVKEPIVIEDGPGLRGDLSVRGVWEAQREALFDIRVTDTDAPSYTSRSVMSILKQGEEEKIKKYKEACESRHATFTPLVTSVDGLFAPQFVMFVKVLGERLAEKMCMQYSRMMGWLRTRIGLSIVRAASMCVRGTRRRFRSGESLLGFE